MAKLKLSVIVPPRPSGPVNSLYPTQQHAKERRFLIIVAPSTTVGELYNIVLEKYQNTYLHGHDRNEFWIEKLQDGNELDLTQDIVLGEFLDDTNAIHVIRVIQGSLDRSSSIPQASSLRPKGFIQERFSDWETSSRKRRKLDENARGYLEAHPDHPRPTTELYTSDVHQAQEVTPLYHAAARSVDANPELRERRSGSAVGNDRMSINHDAENHSQSTSVDKEHVDDGNDQYHVIEGESSGALMPPPKLRPSQRLVHDIRNKSSETDHTGKNQEENVTARPKIAIRDEPTRGRNLRNIFEVPVSDTEQSENVLGSAEPGVSRRTGRTEPDMFTKVAAQTTPSVEAESSPPNLNVSEVSDSVNDRRIQQAVPRDASVITSAKALKKVREYRRVREESSDREKIKKPQCTTTASRNVPPKGNFHTHEPLISDPIESSGAASPTINSASSVGQSKKRRADSSKPETRKLTPSLRSAPVPVTRPALAFSSCNGPSFRMAADSNTNHLVIAASKRDMEGYLAAKRLSLQARIEENDRRRIQDSRSPKAARERQESEKKALRYFQQIQDSQVPISPLSRHTRTSERAQSRTGQGDQDGITRSLQTGIMGQVSKKTEHPRIRPSQELTPTSEPTTNVVAEGARPLRSQSSSLPNGHDVPHKADLADTMTSDRGASVTRSSHSIRASPTIMPTLVPLVMIPNSTNNSVLETQDVAMTPTRNTAHQGGRITRSAHAVGRQDKPQSNAIPQTNGAYVPIAEESQSSDSYIIRATLGPSKPKVLATNNALATDPVRSAPGKLRRLSDKARTHSRQGRLPFTAMQDEGKHRARLSMKAPEQNAVSTSLSGEIEQDLKSNDLANGSRSFDDEASSIPALFKSSMQTATRNNPEVITSGSESSESSSESGQETLTRDTFGVKSSDGNASTQQAHKDLFTPVTNGRVKSSSSTSSKGDKESGPLREDPADDETSLAASRSPVGQAVRNLRSLSSRPRTELIAPAIERSDSQRGSISRRTSTQPRKLSVASKSMSSTEPANQVSSPASSAASSTRQHLTEQNHGRLSTRSASLSASKSGLSARSSKAANQQAAANVPKGKTDGSKWSRSKAASSPPPSPQFHQRHASLADPQRQLLGSPHTSSTSSPSSTSSVSNGLAKGGSLPTGTSALHAHTTSESSARGSANVNAGRSRSSSISSSSSESSDSSFSSHASDEDDAKLQSDLAVLRAPTSSFDASTAAGFAERKSIAAKARMLTSCMYKPLASVFLSSSQAQEHHPTRDEGEGNRPWWDVPSSSSSEAASTSNESVLGEDSDDPGALEAIP